MKTRVDIETPFVFCSMCEYMEIKEIQYLAENGVYTTQRECEHYEFCRAIVEIYEQWRDKHEL